MSALPDDFLPKRFQRLVFGAVLGRGQHGYKTQLSAAAFARATHQSLLISVVFLAETTAQAALVVPAVAYLRVRETAP
jgi:CIC family chloride channel protein